MDQKKNKTNGKIDLANYVPAIIDQLRKEKNIRPCIHIRLR